jgi:inosine/xanthosine triphosphatase
MVIVASTNPAKVEPVRHVFSSFEPALEVVGVNVPSGVPDQPFGWDETSLGARTRARNGLVHPGARYGVGLEGGMLENADGAWLVSIAAIARNDGLEGLSCGGMILLPPSVAARVKSGQELGHVIDDLAGESNTKTRGGAISFLTNARYSRREMWVNALEMALAPILSGALYAVTKSSQ